MTVPREPTLNDRDQLDKVVCHLAALAVLAEAGMRDDAGNGLVWIFTDLADRLKAIAAAK